MRHKGYRINSKGLAYFGQFDGLGSSMVEYVTLNTIIYIIPKYLCRARLTKGKALAISRLISQEVSLDILFRISKVISYTTIGPGIDII